MKSKMTVIIADRVYDFGSEIYRADLALVKIGKVNNTTNISTSLNNNNSQRIFLSSSQPSANSSVE